jgi:hypothetical protein
MNYSTSGSGGGGGFGGFPYRSAHQQGTDGSNPTNRRKKYLNRQKRGGPITCQICIQVPADKVGLIVGRKGTTVKRLTNETKCVFDIPKQQHQRNNVETNGESNRTRLEQSVKIIVKASCIAHLLHACWSIANLVINEEDSDGVQYSMTLQNLPGISIQGVLSKPIQYDSLHETHMKDLPSFMTGTDSEEHSVSAYCVHSDKLDQVQVSTILDNELFIDPSISASVEVINLSENENEFLIFVYGTPSSKAELVYKSILAHSLPK